MKIARLFVLASIALAGCTAETESKDKHLISKEVYNLTLGNQEIYGVRLRLTTTEKMEELGAKVSLMAGEKTFVDTLYLELRKGDTVETEAMFSEATKTLFPSAEAQIEFFPL